MPKIIEVETLRSVTNALAAPFRDSIRDIAKRNGVGHQWVYSWEEKLIYHGIDGCRDLSDTILIGLRDKTISTPTFTKDYTAWDYKAARRKHRLADSPAGGGDGGALNRLLHDEAEPPPPPA